MIKRGGVVAEGELFPDVEEEFGVAAAAEEGVAHQQGGGVLAAAGEAHAQLALGYVQALSEEARFFREDMGCQFRRGFHSGAGQLRQGGAEGGFHPGIFRAAAVENLQPGGGDQMAVALEEQLGMQGGGDLLIAQAGDAVGFAGAHLLKKAAVGIRPLVVENAADGVDEVGLLVFKIILQEEAVPGNGGADQLSQEGGGGFQQPLAAGSEAVVNQAGDEAHALGLALLADGDVDAGAVELVQPGGERPHIGAGDRAPAENGGN